MGCGNLGVGLGTGKMEMKRGEREDLMMWCERSERGEIEREMRFEIIRVEGALNMQREMRRKSEMQNG